MKFCATIAEYNPLHNGHLKHIEYIKNELKAENLVVVMSGNFTQRGEPAVLNKFKRARQAIIAGADAVIELPTVFATANAELFASGGIKTINSMGIVDGICFGAENGNKSDFISLASALNSETKDFKKTLKDYLSGGISLAKAKFLTVQSLYGNMFDESLMNSPNNILGLEYTKAILKTNPDMDIFPMLREGDHNDLTLKKGITSATSIRKAIKEGKFRKTKKCMPPYVYRELEDYPFEADKITMAKIITSSAEELAKISDCTEGLENRIKALAKDNFNIDKYVEKVATKRYPATRIRRILTANLLGIEESFIFDALSSPLYIKVLAVKKDSDVLPLICEKATVPVLTRKSDADKLKKTALACFNKDVLANDLYNLFKNERENEHKTLFV